MGPSTGGRSIDSEQASTGKREQGRARMRLPLPSASLSSSMYSPVILYLTRASRHWLPTSLGPVSNQAKKLSAQDFLNSFSFLKPFIKASITPIVIAVSSVVSPTFKSSQPPPIRSSTLPYFILISSADINSVVAPMASPIAWA